MILIEVFEQFSAFYRFDELTGTFEFKSQETRKGYFQKPTFPRTVITNNNHPVLFSAKGSVIPIKTFKILN